MVLRLEDAISMIIREGGMEGGRKRKRARRRRGMRDKQMNRMEERKRKERYRNAEAPRWECGLYFKGGINTILWGTQADAG